MPAQVIVMGVSGTGKTTVGEGLAERLGYLFGEGDDFHPPENIEAMSHGHPLTDEQRGPWLHAIAAWIARHDAEELSTVVACSALKRSYRDVLRSAAADVRFVHLTADPTVIMARMRTRRGHFMRADMLRSQLDTLEPLGDDERGVTVDVAFAPDQVLESVTAAVRSFDEPRVS